jgi:hypothetical protein
MVSGSKRYFNFSAASGRDVLLGKKDAGAASPGRDLVYHQCAVAGVLERENVFDFDVLLLPAEVVFGFLELDPGLSVAVQDRRQ